MNGIEIEKFQRIAMESSMMNSIEMESEMMIKMESETMVAMESDDLDRKRNQVHNQYTGLVAKFWSYTCETYVLLDKWPSYWM